MVERPLMVRWVVGSNPHVGLIRGISRSSQSSTTGVTKVVVCNVCQLDDAYKYLLLLIGNSSLCSGSLLYYV